MTVYLPRGAKSWYFDFRWRGQRHLGPTHQLTREDAQLVESQIKLRLRQEAGGIAPFDVNATPRFTDWAPIALKYQRRYVDRPDLVQRAFATVLEFCGAQPKKPKRRPLGTNAHHVEPPYHDLRLGHFIADPSWLLKFERWMDARRLSGSTRNSYLSAMSTFYRVARDPQFRAIAKVPSNPFQDIRRSPRTRRLVALDVDQVKTWISKAPQHVRDAMAIAALAPKLRLQSILELEWAVHFDKALTKITVAKHKTAARTALPQITPVDAQLADILRAIQARQLAATKARRSASPRKATGRVITYRGKPVQSIKKATKRSALDAGLRWGVRDGVTFHTLRHSIATLLAELGMAERLRMELMGHKEIRTTQQYTHLAAKSQIAPHEQLSAALALKDVVLGPPAKVRDFRKSSRGTGKTESRKSAVSG